MAASVTYQALSSLHLPASGRIASTRIRVVTGLELQPERSTLELQCAPKAVDQVAPIVVRQTLGPITVAMLYVAGCKRRHLAAIVVIAVAAAPIAWSQLEDYQKRRVMTIVDPSADPQGSGYHTIQSMITVGSGGLTGKGYMGGTQTYLSYLPEHHTDFIFSQLAEEFGFAGSITVLMLFSFLFFRGLRLARNSTDMAGSLLAVGVVTLLAVHVFVNVGITIGILPVTGLPLPFLSYGGSFYLTTMTSIGILLSVNARRGMFDYLEHPNSSPLHSGSLEIL